MERDNRSYDISPEESEFIDTTALDALAQRQHDRKEFEREKREYELTKRMQAAGIPTGAAGSYRHASSVNNKTRRRGGSHRRSWGA